jgi:hypothetical protein
MRPRWPLLAAVTACVSSSSATECEFLVGFDIQIPAGLPGAGSELKVVAGSVGSSQECCDLCGAMEGCSGAAWNGNDASHLNSCYMKGAGAVPVKRTEGTIACVRRKSSGAAGWGIKFLLSLTIAACAYLGGGVLLGGGGATGGLRGHPHRHRWSQLAGLVADGVAIVRGRGGVGVMARQKAERHSGGPPEESSTRSKRHKQKRKQHKDSRKREAQAPLLGSPPSQSETPPLDEASSPRRGAGGNDNGVTQGPTADVSSSSSRPDTTASAGGGRWVHVPT